MNTYPPFVALLFVPATLGRRFAEIASVLGNLLLLFVVCWQSIRLAAGRTSRAAVGVLAAVALWSEPVAEVRAYGQVNLQVLALVLLGPQPASRFPSARASASAWPPASRSRPALHRLSPTDRTLARSGDRRLGTRGDDRAVGAVDAGATWTYWTVHLFDVGRIGAARERRQPVGARMAGTVAPQPGRRARRDLLVLAVLVAADGLRGLAQRRLGDLGTPLPR